MDIYLEAGVGGHTDDATQAWTFDSAAWGRCGQGSDEESALNDLMRQVEIAKVGDCRVVERIQGDEQAFQRDLEPVLPIERVLTKQILTASRISTIEIIKGCSPAELDWIDPDRQLPTWATWHSIRAMAWHLLETESSYYLPRIGFEPLQLGTDLLAELATGGDRVARAIDALPSSRLSESNGEQWTPTKVLRRLAWHERAELVAITDLAAKARQALDTGV